MMNIVPGIGVGAIQYGMSEDEVITLMGKPDKINEEEYVEGSGDWRRALWYSPRNITFTFDMENDYRLGTITIMGSGYRLFGKELFNASKSLVRKVVAEYSQELLPVEDYIEFDDGPHECLSSDILGIMFWFDSDNLTEMQCSYLFEADNETEIWPFGQS